jgi:hypothetical protein
MDKRTARHVMAQDNIPDCYSAPPPDWLVASRVHCGEQWLRSRDQHISLDPLGQGGWYGR